MKNIIYTILFFTFLLIGTNTNAQSQVNVYEDPFKEIKTAFSCITVPAKSNVSQLGSFDNTFRTNFLFYKKIEKGVAEIEMRLHIRTGVLQKVEKEIYLETDAGISKLISVEAQDAFFRQEEVTTQSNGSDDSSTNQYLYYTQKKLEYTYLLSEKTQKEILESKFIFFRIYVDDIPFNLDFTVAEVRELKSLLEAE